MPTPHDILDDFPEYDSATRSEVDTMFDDEDFDAAYRQPQTAAVALANDDDRNEPTTAATAVDDDRIADEDAYERIGEYLIHFAASEFPLLGGKDFEDLVASIRDSGQTSPIMQTKDGLILDGRNRLRAIYQLRAEGHTIGPWVKTWDAADGQTEIEYILAANLHRRHLTDTERAMIAAELVPAIAIEAEEK